MAIRLKDAGIDVRGPKEREGWAWGITADVDGIAIDTVVGLVDDMESVPPRQWLLTTDSPIAFWNRMFASKAVKRNRERSLRRYCEILHHSFMSEPRFSNVLWYDKDTFDKPGDIPAAIP
ncbi:MAG: hypothetical protein Q8M16_00285 [Pirellulaceae bacterium]|nr:hypothetical protein [Pirellulaceae bacterium]